MISRKQYPPNERRRVHNRIAALSRAGASQREIADKMNKEGFRSPSGKPLTGDLVANYSYYGGIVRGKKRRLSERVGVAATACPTCRIFLEILSRSAITKSQRAALMKGLVST